MMSPLAIFLTSFGLLKFLFELMLSPYISFLISSTLGLLLIVLSLFRTARQMLVASLSEIISKLNFHTELARDLLNTA